MKKFQLLASLALLFTGLLVTNISSHAQETTASITGIVTDSKGPMPGVAVVAVHTPTGITYSTSTRSDGRYNLNNVRIGGPYRLTAQILGYQARTLPEFNLSIAQEFQGDVLLSESTVQLKEVKVVARQDKTFNDNKTGSSDVISRVQIDRLPTVSRSINSFLRVNPLARSQNSSGGSTSFGGRPSNQNNLTVNGVQFNNTFGLSSSIGGLTQVEPISLDAIEELQISIAPFDVRQGNFTSAGINSVTRSGTNQIKGAAYDYFKNQRFISKRVGDVQVENEQSKSNLSGFYVGFPIIKNKFFAFLNVENENRITPTGSNYRASRSTDATIGVGQISRPNADTLTRLANFLKSTYGYDPGPFEAYDFKIHGTRLTTRFDYQIDKNNTANLNIFYLNSYRDLAASQSTLIGNQTGGRQPSTSVLPFFGSGYRIFNRLYSGIFELNSRLSNRSFNKLQVSLTIGRDHREPSGKSDFPLVNILYGAGLVNQLGKQAPPGREQNTYTVFGYEPFTYNNQLNSDIYQLNDYFTFYTGKHEITVGTQSQIQKYKNGFAQKFQGEYVFPSLDAFYRSAVNQENTASAYSLRYSATPDGSFPFAALRNYQLGFLAQDRFRVTNRFLLTYGLRIDVPIIPKDPFARNPVVDTIQFQNGQTISTDQIPKTRILWSPRIGFNWDVTGNKNLQLRGGAGMFQGAPPQVWLSNQANDNGVIFGSYTVATTPDAPQITDPLSGRPLVFSPNPNEYRPVSGAANPVYDLSATGTNFKFPQIFKADVAVDYKLPLDITATAELLYTKDINAVYFKNLALSTDFNRLTGTPDDRPRYVNNKGTTLPTGVKATTERPSIGNVILLTNSNKGQSTNFVLALERNVGNLRTSFSYAYSRSLYITEGASTAFSNWSGNQVVGDPNADILGFPGGNQPHRLLGTVSYRVPYARHLATSVGVIYEGASSGSGSYTVSGDLSNTGVSSNQLVYIPRNQKEIFLQDITATNPDNTVRVTTTADQQWRQLDAFISQDKYLRNRRGQYAEKNALVYPFFNKLDLNLSQDFYFRQKNGRTNTLRFSCDVLNLTNLLNKNWGTYRQATNQSLLRFVGVDNNNAPAYQYTNTTEGRTSFRPNTGIDSRWQIQLGLRYIFN